jgi:hypothetical protein
MCVERFHRLMMAALLIVTILLFISAKEVLAIAILVFMVLMLSIWAVFDFCPALKILSKFMKSCDKKCA